MRASRCARPSPTRAIFPAAGFLQYAVEDQPVRLIALDTLVEGKPYGELCEERLAWLEARLGRAERQARDALHAPSAVRMRHRRLRPCRGCRTATSGWPSWCGGTATVERAVCGHVHRPIQVRWAGTMASIAPSTAHQATLDLHDGRAAHHDDGAAGDRAASVAAATAGPVSTSASTAEPFELRRRDSTVPKPSSARSEPIPDPSVADGTSARVQERRRSPSSRSVPCP